MVVLRADRHKVGQIGWSVVWCTPPDDVVGGAVVEADLTARNGTCGVQGTQCPTLILAGQPTRPAKTHPPRRLDDSWSVDDHPADHRPPGQFSGVRGGQVDRQPEVHHRW